MYKLFKILASFGLFFTLISSAIGNETPLSCQEILQKVDLAIDPQNKGGSIRNFELNSVTTISKNGSFDCDYQMIFKSPDKFRTSVKILALSVYVIFNGKDGWVVSPFRNEKLPDIEAQSTLQQIQFMNVAMKYSKALSTAELMDEIVEINGRKCYEIHGKLPDYFSGIPLKLFIDCETFYILHYSLEIAADNKKAIINVYNDEFGEFDGIFLPTVSHSQAGKTKFKNSVKSVRFNIDIDDKIFEISNY